MKRREFLKQAGQGTVALASAPALAHMLSRVALAQGGTTNYHFLAFSSAGVVAGVDHRIAAVGDGLVTPGGVTGGGAFVHFDNLPPAPKPILGTGSWKAKRLLSFQQFGTWGALSTGVLEMEITLVPVSGAPIDAMLNITCNLGPANLFVTPPAAEGYTLTIPGFLTFTPLVPALGLTVFTVVNENRD
ncbi:MAG: hypothetical protein ACRDGJ_09145 [Candidatus Limnocylindria bacterium]